MADVLKVLVLAGGPDRERAVSLQSGAAVAEGLREAGHAVMERDIGPDDLSALDEFVAWCGEGGEVKSEKLKVKSGEEQSVQSDKDHGGKRGGGVIFPALHGVWGEGGAVQGILETRGLRYVGCGPEASALCMDKHRAKEAMIKAGIPTPKFAVVRDGEAIAMEPPVVIKPSCEGSSIDMAICLDRQTMSAALSALSGKRRKRSDELLVEQFVKGKELTVGVLDGKALPALQIIPATQFYDYDAKYVRDDTQYLFDIDLPTSVLDEVQAVALRTFATLGCRQLSRVDVMVDESHRVWVLEVNTMPGFTSHSLVPKAAAQMGISFSALVDGLVRGAS